MPTGAAHLASIFFYAFEPVHAFRYFTPSPEYAGMGRVELSAASLIAQLGATNHWGSMAAEFFELAAPKTGRGKLEHEFFGDRRGALPATSP